MTRAPDPAEVRARAASAVLKYIEDADGLWANDAAKVVDIVLAFASATEAPPVAASSGDEFWRRVAQQSARHIDALLLYATSYPTDSHALDGYAFLIRLYDELGEKRTPRTEQTFAARARGRMVMPPFPEVLTKPTPPASVSGEVVTQAHLALAEQVVSAANIVSHDGYYEIDIDAVAKVLAAAPEAATPSVVGGVDRMREAFEAGFNAAERGLGFEGCDGSAEALEIEWAEYKAALTEQPRTSESGQSALSRPVEAQ